jgi:hypothetical protein
MNARCREERNTSSNFYAEIHMNDCDVFLKVQIIQNLKYP